MQYAVITGATKGIGKAIAEKLLSEGFSIAICARNKEDLLQLEKKWTDQYPGRYVICHKTDVAKKEEVFAFADYVLNAFPKIDLVVNNAGMFIPGNLADEPEGHLENLLSVNLLSVYHLTRHLLPAMKQNKSGHIFNMCSVASLKAYPAGGSYGISKYALMGFSENLREELIPHNIKVTALYPGATFTPTWDGSGHGAEKMMQSEDIADMLWACYTLSSRANVETIVMRPLKGDL